MPFWKKRDSTGDAGEEEKSKEKVNYKARLEHKQYLVRSEKKALSSFILSCPLFVLLCPG